MENRDKFYSNLFLVFIVCSTLIGGVIRIGPASLYHFVLFGILLLILCSNFIFQIDFKNPMLKFMIVFFLEAIVSVLWAPDKSVAIQYIYYIFLLFILAFLIDVLTSVDNITFFISLMVVILFVLNIISIWETITNNHLVANYLVGSRGRTMAYVPGGFFYNPNDLATYIMQILPFSMVTIINGKKVIRGLSIINIFLSIYVIFKTSARTQIILLGIVLFIFLALVAKSKKIVSVTIFCVIGFIIAYKLYPDLGLMIQDGLNSVSVNEIEMSSSDGGSLGTRIELFKNAIEMVINTFGFGVGAGCHRVLMSQYSKIYHNVGRITVMHNLIGELLADYGIFIGFYFIYTLIILFYKLINIYKFNRHDEVKNLAALFAVNICIFLICAICSSSIIQLSSLWVPLFYIGAFVRMNTCDNIKEVEYNEKY